MTDTSCPKCNGEMIDGRIPSPMKYFFGFKSFDQKQFSFETNIHKAKACIVCGYIDLYLDPDELNSKRK